MRKLGEQNGQDNTRFLTTNDTKKHGIERLSLNDHIELIEKL